MEDNSQKLDRLFYGQDALANRIPSHFPNDQIEIFIKKGRYRVDLTKTRFMYRPILKITGNHTKGLLLNDDLACFQVQDIQFDDKSILKRQGNRSRPIFRAFWDRKCKYNTCYDAPLSSYGKKEYDTGFQTTANEQAYNIGLEPLLSYQMNFNIRTEQIRRFYNIANNTFESVQNIQNDSAQATRNSQFNVQCGDNEQFTWFSPFLSDICFELSGMTDINMDQFKEGIKITLDLIEPRYAMSLAVPIIAVASDEFLMVSTDSYFITDTTTLVRKMPYNQQNGLKEIKFTTYQYDMRDLTADAMKLFWLNFSAQLYRGTIILFTGIGVAMDLEVSEDQQDYKGDLAYNSACIEYNKTHFFLPDVSAELQIDEMSFKPLQLPISQYELASYISAIDGFECMFPGYQYGVPMSEFIDKSYAIVIPVCEKGIKIDDKRLALNLEFGSKGIHSNKHFKYQIHVFHIMDGYIQFGGDEIKVAI